MTERSAIEFGIFAVGGTAIDILRDVKAGNTSDPAAGLEHTSLYFIDTSDSNSITLDQDKLYRFPGLNGGGKNRIYITEKTRPHISDLLKKMKPKKFNLVVFGAGGASGSGVGPQLVTEMIRSGLNVMVAVVGSAVGSHRELENTIFTIKTLAGAVKVLGKPLTMFYRQNDERNAMGLVDKDIRSLVYAASALFCNLNHGVEETDLSNFLNYHTVTKVAPTLCNIDFYNNEISIPTHVVPVCQATLHPSSTEIDELFDTAYPGVAYRTSGTLNAVFNDLAPHGTPINFMLMRGDAAVRLKELDRRLAQMTAEQQQREAEVEDIDLGDNIPADGFYG